MSEKESYLASSLFGQRNRPSRRKQLEAVVVSSGVNAIFFFD